MIGPASFDVFNCPLEGIRLVEASAGTGKTWNICGLYLRLLLERQMEVQHILVVTFTNAATAELRERVRARIVEMLAHLRAAPPGRARPPPAGPAPGFSRDLFDTSDDGAATAPEAGRGATADAATTGADDPFVAALASELEARGRSRADMIMRLELALQAFDEAAILTIHGWCQRALADTPFAAALPFALELQPDDSDLRMEAVHDFWRRHIAGEGCSPQLAAWLVQKRDAPDKLARLLARHLARPLAHVRWPASIDQPLDVDADALDAAYEAARRMWLESRDEVVARVKASPSLNRNRYKPAAIAAAANEWDAYFRAGDALAPLKSRESKIDQFRTTQLVACTNKGGTTPVHPFFDRAEALLAARESVEPALERARLRLFRTLLDEAPDALRRRKRERRIVSYDDLLSNLYRALCSGEYPGLAASLRARFPAALIDEFQDTDPVQFAIFRAIYGSGEVPLFLVGDPKQAIYGFRHADLHTYLKARAQVGGEYTLNDNQRSTPGLIAAVNTLFGANSRAFMLDGLGYHAVRQGAKPRQPLQDATEPRGELHVWTLPAGDGVLERSVAKAAATQATAAEIARLLRAGKAGAITLGGMPLRPRDIAVLVRSHRDGAQVKQALGLLGIDAVELSRSKVFQAVEAEEVERVLTAILTPSRTELVRAALATSLFGLDAAAIDALAADEARLMSFVQRFLGYRDTWMQRGIGVMYRELLTAEGVGQRALSRPDGERRLTNLLHLAELMHVAAEGNPSPDALLRWLAAQRRDKVDDEVAQLRLESDQNLVQIVTVHKAKGLEYPVVFCPFLWDGFVFAGRDSLDGKVYHDDRGESVIDFRLDDEVDEAEARTIAARTRLEGRAEDLRLIYVALTRASHRCYIVAGNYVRNTGRAPSPKESSCSLLNWLVTGAGVAPADWIDRGAPPETIEQAWTNLGVTCAPHVAVDALPTVPGQPLDLVQPAADTLFAAAPPSHIAEPWRISSFSGLHDGAVSEIAARDHGRQGEDAPALPALPPPDLAADDILRFPRGTRAGDCLHAALERADFSGPSTWEHAARRALRDHPAALPGLPSAAQQEVLRRMVLRMIGDVVRTPLPGGIRLDAVPPPRRLIELEFDLPAHRLAATTLNATLHALGYAVDRLTFPQFHGYLKGFIDLVFEHGGRYYLLDWKSNHLGYTSADYEPASLRLAMAQHGYHLQSLIYSVALARYLALRIPGYRHDRHFGGALYLFVRGVRPAWLCADGSATGVHFDRPSAATLARLEALLDAPARERA
jgi:exodeoxyribonuclease V beta subunit